MLNGNKIYSINKVTIYQVCKRDGTCPADLLNLRHSPVPSRKKIKFAVSPVPFYPDIFLKYIFLHFLSFFYFPSVAGSRFVPFCPVCCLSRCPENLSPVPQKK